MEIQHFQSFEQKHSDPDFNIILKHEIVRLNENLARLNQNLSTENLSKEFKNILDCYNKYSEETRNGANGLTPQYWMSYIDMIHLYHDFSRSIRTGDLELYVFCLPKLADYFFAFNHPNYARWIVRHYDNLLKLNTCHPELYTEFRNGCFSIKRTKKSFSRTPTDLTIEQTINKDPACQRTGISAITNSIAARQDSQKVILLGQISYLIYLKI